MGLLTLVDFHDELSHMLEALGPGQKRGNTRLTRLLNMGYFELTNSVEFKDLLATQAITTVSGTRTYGEATALRSVKAVIDETNTTNLRRISIENLLRLDPATESKPERWAREGGLFYFHPVPDGVYTVRVYHYIQPTALSADTDTTVLNAVWDQAVLLLAAKNGALIDRDTGASELFLQSARLYIGSREQDFALDSSSQSVGVTVAMTEEDLLELE